MECDLCGRQEHMGYTCKKCGEHFCKKHRLPESHDCIGLKVEKAEREIKRQEGERQPWFKTPDRANSETRAEKSNRGREASKRRKTKRERLEEKQSEKYKSPDVNVDGSVGDSGYESEIESSSTNSNRVKSSIGSLMSNIKTRYRLWKVKHRMKSKTSIALRLAVVCVVLIVGLGMVGYGPTSGMGPTEVGSTVVGSASEVIDQESTGDEAALEDDEGGDDDSGLLETITSNYPEQYDEDTIEKEFIEYLNEERAERGLQQLDQRDDLRDLGENHTEDMVEHDYFSHTDSEGRYIDDRFADAGLLPECELEIGGGTYYPGVENLAQFHVNERLIVPYQDSTIRINDESDAAEHLFDGWMHSDGHREAMLVHSASEAGLGITITEDGEIYAALMLC